MKELAKFRTIHEAAIEIKTMDSKTAITENFIRSLVKSNKINYIKQGNKALIDLNVLVDFLSSNKIYEYTSLKKEEKPQKTTYSYIDKIRKLS